MNVDGVTEDAWSWVVDVEWFWDTPSWKGWAEVSACPELLALEMYVLTDGERENMT